MKCLKPAADAAPSAAKRRNVGKAASGGAGTPVDPLANGSSSEEAPLEQLAGYSPPRSPAADPPSAADPLVLY